MNRPFPLLALLGGGGLLLWWWLSRGSSGSSGSGSMPVSVVGPKVTNEDSSGLGAAALFAFLANGAGGGSAPDVQLNTSGLNVNVRNREGAFESFLRNWCAGDPGDGICRSAGAQNILTRSPASP